MKLEKLISVARGDLKADLLLKDANLINTFTGDIENTNIAIYKEKVAGIGNYKNAHQIIDLKGNYIAPTLIDGHVHLESSMLHPVSYAKILVPKGVLTAITDLHEITNVCGLEGIKFYLKWEKEIPMDIFLMAPSCVPSTDLETSGAKITTEELAEIFTYRNTIGLGEMMNFKGIIEGKPEVLNKIIFSSDKIIDGHAPKLSNYNLNAYIASGIRSDHETTNLEEGKEKLRRGLYLMIRDGTSEKNLLTLLPLINNYNFNRCMLVSDDKNCSDLLEKGGFDHIVRKAIKNGLDPVRALQFATINPANYFQLHNRGGITPGYIANIMSFDSLEEFEPDIVIYKGKLVVKKNQLLFNFPKFEPELTNTINIGSIDKKSLQLHIKNQNAHDHKFPVIKIIPNQILTKKQVLEVKLEDNIIKTDIDRDILKLVVVERHKASGNIGIGLVKGFGLKKGALASSIAHDSHNIVCVGVNDSDILTGINYLEDVGGGIVVCKKNKILASLPLPIAGLLSDLPLEEVNNKFNILLKSVHQLGDVPSNPFAIMSFLALPVIPEIRLTDKGIVDLTEII